MKKLRGGLWLAATLFATVVALTNLIAFAQTAQHANVTVHWHTMPIVTIHLTPNYVSGFGAIPATIGTQPAPTHGPNAVLDGGSVDFGTVLAGKNYIYKYATHLNVASSDQNGVDVYGEGAANFLNTADSSTLPISSTVYYLNSTSGSPADTNTGFSPAAPFLLTNGTVVGGGSYASAPSITYLTYPSPISTATTANADFYYDYQLKVPVTATGGLYYVWIVYTVVGQ